MAKYFLSRKEIEDLPRTWEFFLSHFRESQRGKQYELVTDSHFGGRRGKVL